MPVISAEALLPGSEFGFRQRFEEALVDTDLPAHRAEAACRRGSLEGHEPRHGLTAPSDDYLIACFGVNEEARQAGLGLMHVHSDRRHRQQFPRKELAIILANRPPDVKVQLLAPSTEAK